MMPASGFIFVLLLGVLLVLLTSLVYARFPVFLLVRPWFR